jgi:hypothetical protein
MFTGCYRFFGLVRGGIVWVPFAVQVKVPILYGEPVGALAPSCSSAASALAGPQSNIIETKSFRISSRNRRTARVARLGSGRLLTKVDMTEFREVSPASAPLEPTLDESVSASTGGASTTKSSQESRYGKSEQT